MANNKNQYKFTEGKVLQFTITGYNEIPGTDESFYILENPFGGKHLLKSVEYAHYNLKINQKINCKIDKINCSGKIYLEPENPIYKEGGIYDFEFVKIVDQINSIGENEKAAIVKDQFGIEIACSLPINHKLNYKQKVIKCQVLRIKKGQLFLSHPKSELFHKSLKIGKKYWFTVVDIKELENNIDYYMLKDKLSNLYSLKMDMYEHYSFGIGQKIECTVAKYNTDGHLKIEPVHPHYEIGEIYSFKYLRTETDFNPLGIEENVIIVEDILGVETKVRSSNFITNKKSISQFIQCKVDGIRKGKAILSI